MPMLLLRTAGAATFLALGLVHLADLSPTGFLYLMGAALFIPWRT